LQPESRRQIDQFVVNPSLYTFDTDRLIDIVESHADDVDRLMLVGHNPALTGLAQVLTGHRLGDLANLPTCAVLVLNKDTEAVFWSAGQARLVQSARPRDFKG